MAREYKDSANREHSYAGINYAEEQPVLERKLKDSGIEWIGEIPSDWKTERIKALFSERNERNCQGKTLLSVSQYFGIRPKSETDLADSHIAESYDDYKVVYKGDFVMNIMLAWNGSYAVSGYDGIVSPAYCVFKFRKDCFKKYFHYLLRTDGYPSAFETMSRGVIDSRLRLYPEQFFTFPVIIPPVIEQKKIAVFLDEKCGEIDKLVSLQEQMIEELKAYKQSVITEAVTKGLNPDAPMKDSGIDWIGYVPKGWKISRIKNIFRLRTGTTPKAFEQGLDSDALVNWFTPSDVTEMNCELKVSERHLSKEIIDKEGIELSPAGSLIFVGIGASAGKIGYAMVEGYSNQQITTLIPIQNKCFGKFSYYYMIADRKRIKDNAFYTTLPIINNSYLSEIKTLLPPIDEQRSIALYLDTKCAEIDSLINIKRQKIESLMEYKKSIIFEYVTGKKQVV